MKQIVAPIEITAIEITAKTRRWVGMLVSASSLSLFLLATPALAGGLTVVSVEPARHSLAAAQDAAISVTFDVPVDPAAVGAASFWAFARWSGAVSGSYAFSNGNRTVSLVPDRPFSAGESVMVILSHDLAAAGGGTLRDAGYSFQFWVRAKPAGLTFTEIATMSTASPSRPYGGIGSDLDGDGYLDITTVNEDTSDLRVFMNAGDGSGTFGDFLQPTFPSGTVPSPSEPSDFNRDGHVDIVVASTQAATAAVLLGNGDGTFGAQQVMAVDGNARGIAVLDVDGDGDVDFVTASPSTSSLTLLFNNGSGVFGSPTSFGSGNGGEWALGAADMNDDGILDLVAGGRSSGRLFVYLGNGDGTFNLDGDYPSGGAVWMLVLGDLNGDGNEDVAVGNGTSDNGAVLLGDGAGGLGAPQIHAVDPIALASDIGDLDGDGDLDWMLASFNGDWTLLSNDGSGNFIFEREIDAPAAASCSLMMDIDNDGDLDLTLIDEIADEVLILRNDGTIFSDAFESGDLSGWS
ncbi:MAG: FG-GAP-like repeat-containing protein [Acidobacteriota bacterium]